MRVYRCIKLQEVINKYKNKKGTKINNPNLNTHMYESGKEYIHFFKYEEFARYYFNLGKEGSYDKSNANYILFMTANIPKKILDKYKGFGFYELNQEKIIMPEYAIPIEEFDTQYIVDITDKPMGFNIRKHENEEYKRYLELIKNLKQTTNDVKSIGINLLKIDLDKLIGIEIDDRSENEIEKDANLLLSSINFSRSNDDELKSWRVAKK